MLCLLPLHFQYHRCSGIHTLFVQVVCLTFLGLRPPYTSPSSLRLSFQLTAVPETALCHRPNRDLRSVPLSSSIFCISCLRLCRHLLERLCGR